MKVYIDSSALVKYFHQEQGSSDVIDIIESKSNSVFISELAITELTSAFYRRFRMNEISASTLSTANFAIKIKTLAWNIEPLTSIQNEEAERIIKSFGNTVSIRTLDALHLAAYSLLQNDSEWEFIVADKALENTAKLAGFATRFIQ